MNTNTTVQIMNWEEDPNAIEYLLNYNYSIRYYGKNKFDICMRRKDWYNGVNLKLVQHPIRKVFLNEDEVSPIYTNYDVHSMLDYFGNPPTHNLDKTILEHRWEEVKPILCAEKALLLKLCREHEEWALNRVQYVLDDRNVINTLASTHFTNVVVGKIDLLQSYVNHYNSTIGDLGTTRRYGNKANALFVVPMHIFQDTNENLLEFIKNYYNNHFASSCGDVQLNLSSAGIHFLWAAMGFRKRENLSDSDHFSYQTIYEFFDSIDENNDTLNRDSVVPSWLSNYHHDYGVLFELVQFADCVVPMISRGKRILGSSVFTSAKLELSVQTGIQLNEPISTGELEVKFNLDYLHELTNNTGTIARHKVVTFVILASSSSNTSC
jgi:hypothetical protein